MSWRLSNNLITICSIEQYFPLDAQANPLWGDMSQSVAREGLLHVTIRQSPGKDMRM